MRCVQSRIRRSAGSRAPYGKVRTVNVRASLIQPTTRRSVLEGGAILASGILLPGFLSGVLVRTIVHCMTLLAVIRAVPPVEPTR